MVLGAHKNRASIALHDATEATCDVANNGLMAVTLDIENYADFGNSIEIVKSKSQAKLTFFKN